MGPTAAISLRDNARRTRGSGVLGHEPIDLQLAGERDGVDFAGRHSLEQGVHCRVVVGVPLDKGRHVVMSATRSRRKRISVSCGRCHTTAPRRAMPSAASTTRVPRGHELFGRRLGISRGLRGYGKAHRKSDPGI